MVITRTGNCAYKALCFQRQKNFNLNPINYDNYKNTFTGSLVCSECEIEAVRPNASAKEEVGSRSGKNNGDERENFGEKAHL